MLTIIESPLFSRLWPDYWTEEEKGIFMAFLASHPDSGNVIPRSGGCRKIRWSMEGRGKSGSVRIIYTTQLQCGAVVALLIYGKGTTESIPAHVLYKIAKEMNHATH
ncbi:transcriptional regulator [Pseudomonas synxantha]|uniref:Transcriptional regulator n=1 Tax=Pseudomonas synxantha TaxID=47883 RepID=A0ABS0UE91_9PSED|nr:transcriptional regulator [Pseudomonas synxantha]MBI6581128.1 transcriptional regulator [Pseudomonas synxantha]MBI6642314.1 transcriptional regulator [Pseudomonas synxantha]